MARRGCQAESQRGCQAKKQENHSGIQSTVQIVLPDWGGGSLFPLRSVPWEFLVLVTYPASSDSGPSFSSMWSLCQVWVREKKWKCEASECVSK